MSDVCLSVGTYMPGHMHMYHGTLGLSSLFPPLRLWQGVCVSAMLHTPGQLVHELLGDFPVYSYLHSSAIITDMDQHVQLFYMGLNSGHQACESSTFTP